MKRIGISQRVVTVGDYGERRDYLDQKWSELMATCGLLPVPLSNAVKDTGVYVGALDLSGIILSGGEDLQEYGGPEDSRIRDAFERKLIEYCTERTLPILGVCRGMQLLNVFHGGTLVAVEGHVGKKHALDVLDPDSLGIGDGPFLVNSFHILVNSFHNYSINQQGLASHFKPLAVSSDGHIEAFLGSDRKQLGVMWHPERENPFNPRNIAMIRNFFQAGG